MTSTRRAASPTPQPDHILPTVKAQVLAESLPWLLQFQGKTVVIKLGGHANTDPAALAQFTQDVLFLRVAGLKPVIVHGGGPQVNEMLDRLQIESEFAGGYRVTTNAAMEVVRMVLTGQVQRDLVGALNTHGTFAVGMSGEDARTILAEPQAPVQVAGVDVDLGRAGSILQVKTDFIDSLLAQGLIPVISSIAADHAGEALNVNADIAAGAIAVALKAHKLVMLTDVPGLYRNYPESDEVISALTAFELEQLLPQLSGGMVPKMTACLTAIRAGCAQAHVIDGTVPHSLLLELFTDHGAGTMVVRD